MAIETTSSSTESADLNSAAKLSNLGVTDEVEAQNKSASRESEDETQEASDASKKASAKDEKAELESKKSEDKDEDILDEDPTGVKKRIGKLRKKISLEAQEKEKERLEKEYWKAEALKAKGLQESKKDEPKLEASQAASDEPNPDNYDSPAEYYKALGKWTYRQEKLADEAKTKQDQLKSENQKKAESFQKKIDEFKKIADDFDEAMEDVDDIPGNIGVGQAILDSEIGPELMYELAKNRELYEKITKLDPINAAREVGKVEARLLAKSQSSKEKPQEPKQTKAPAPIGPVGNKGSASALKPLNDESISYREYEKRRMQEIKSKR